MHRFVSSLSVVILNTLLRNQGAPVNEAGSPAAKEEHLRHFTFL